MEIEEIKMNQKIIDEVLIYSLIIYRAIRIKPILSNSSLPSHLNAPGILLINVHPCQEAPGNGRKASHRYA